MEIKLILLLLAVGVIPMILAFLLPRKQEFFALPQVKGFGLGVYAALVIVLLREASEHDGFVNTISFAVLGLFISFIIGIFIKEFHHHHSDEEKSHRHTKASTWRILISDFFHNIVDGVAIISGFAINPSVGLTSFVGILGHQMIQQSGQQVLLVESGIKPKKALGISFLVSLSIFVALFFQGGEELESALIAISAGIVSWKVYADIVHTKWQPKTIVGFLFGVFLLAGVMLLIPHTH